MNRPLVWAAAAFSAGVWAGAMHNHSVAWIAGLAFLLLGAWFFPKPLPYRDGIPIALVFLLAGAALEGIQRPARLGDPLSAHNHSHPEAIYLLEGEVTDAPIYSRDLDYMPVRLKVDRVESGGRTLPLHGRMVLRWSDPRRPLHPGERIRVRGRLDPVLGEVNIGVGGSEDYYRTLGYHSVMRLRGEAVEWLSSPRLNVQYWASRLRQWQAETFTKTAPADVQTFLRAVWLGDRAAYTEEAYRPYLETGTAHILSVSGVHVGIVYLSLQGLLKSLIRHRKRRTLLILAIILLFALVTGARPPILRAVIMIGLFLWAELLDREPDAPTALSIAALLFLIVNPGLLGDTAFLLSFGSLASILVFSEALSGRMTAVPLAIRQNVATTIGVSILPLPLGAHFFHVVPIIGPLCNLIVIPMLTGILWLCMLVVLVAPFSLAAASLFGHAAAPLIHAIDWLALAFARAPGAFITVTSPTLAAGLLYMLAAVGLARILFDATHRKRWLAVSATALCLSWALWRPVFPPAALDILDVGHGDATFIRTPGGSTLLVDAGNKTDYLDMGSRVVAPWMLAHGIDSLDYLVVTHADSDHIGGVSSVLKKIHVGEVVLWPAASENSLELGLIAQCAQQGIPVRRVQAGDSLPVRGASITVVHPAPGSSAPGINNQSVVLHLTWPSLSALLAGDIEAEAERELLRTLPRADILKAPHHGSHTSSSGAFLDAVSPRIATVSTRASNTREATGPGVMARYEARGIAVYRTDYLGGIRIQQRGGSLVVQSARKIRGYSLAPEDNGPLAK